MKLYTESKQPIILLNETLVHNSMAIGKIVKSNMHDINVYSTENQFEKGKLISCYYKNEKNMYVREQFGNKNTFSVDPENRIVYDSRKHQVAVYYYDVFIPDNCSPEVANAIRHMAKIDNAKNALMAYVAYDYKCYVEERKKYIYLMNSIIVAAIIPIFYLIMNLTLNQKEVKYYLDMGDTGMKVCTIISLLISFLLCAYTSFLSKPNIKKSFIALRKRFYIVFFSIYQLICLIK